MSAREWHRRQSVLVPPLGLNLLHQKMIKGLPWLHRRGRKFCETPLIHVHPCGQETILVPLDRVSSFPRREQEEEERRAAIRPRRPRIGSGATDTVFYLFQEVHVSGSSVYRW